jgi:hypothetical protein
MAFSTDALTLQFLTWVAAQPRTYADTMEAWRTSCPRLSIWEDAIRENLVQIGRAPQQSMKLAAVMLTAQGHAFMREHDAAARGAGTGAETPTTKPAGEPATAEPALAR